MQEQLEVRQRTLVPVGLGAQLRLPLAEPHPQRAVGPRREQPLAAGSEGDAGDGAGVAPQHQQAGPRAQVPDTQGAVPPAARREPAVGSKCQSRHRLTRPGVEGAQAATTAQVMEAHQPVAVAGEHLAPVRRDRQRRHRGARPAQTAQQAASLQLPDQHRTGVVRGHRDPLPGIQRPGQHRRAVMGDRPETGAGAELP